MRPLLSTDHFSVDGTLVEAWASMKSFRPKDGSGEPPSPGGGRNRETDFHGETRSNETHASTTDPEARLYRKGLGKEAKLCFMGHALMENRNGLVVDAGHAERIAALHMIEPCADRPRSITLGADKGYGRRGLRQRVALDERDAPRRTKRKRPLVGDRRPDDAPRAML